MGKRTDIRDQRSKSSLLLDLIQSGAAEELAEVQDRVSYKYLKDEEEEWLERRGEAGVYRGIKIGYPQIEKVIGGLEPGELWTIGGDTGHGKSLLAMNIAQNVFSATQKPVLFINLELTEDQARERFYELSGVDRDYSGIAIQSHKDLEAGDVESLIEKAKEDGFVLVVVDHLHFFAEAMDEKAASSITILMKGFKKAAVKYEMPIIMLSHVTPQTRIVNGEVETIKPDIHNLKNSRSIEQISDMVGFVFRTDDRPNVVEFYLRKNRSRQLIKDSVELEQDGWVLKTPWWKEVKDEEISDAVPPTIQQTELGDIS